MSASPAPVGGVMEEPAARIAVKHHLFTSFGGYGSLKTSDDLEPEVKDALDERVAPLAAAASREPLRSTFPVGRYVALTSVFMMGVDHAGRPRAIAHTVLVERAVARTLPWFLPLAVGPSIFIGPDTPPGGIADVMTPDVALDQLCPPIDADGVEAAAHAPAASALLAALATRRARTAVIGDPGASLRLLALLSALVPAERRSEVAVLTGSDAGGAGGGAALEASTVVVVLRQSADLHDEGLARVEVATGHLEGRLVRGVASLGLSAYIEHRDPHAIAALDACFARWSEDEAPGEPPRAFVRAFATLRPWVRADGSIGLVDDAWPGVASAIPPASEGGARGLAAALLQDGVGRAAAAQNAEAVRDIFRAIRESLAAAPLPEASRMFLAAEIAATVERLSDGRDAMRKWKAAPEALRGVAGEAEALLAVLVESHTM